MKCTICQQSTVFNFSKNKIEKEKYENYKKLKESHFETSRVDVNKDQILNNSKDIPKAVSVDEKQRQAFNCDLGHQKKMIKDTDTSFVNKKRKKKKKSLYAGLNPSVLKKININKNKKS